MSSKLFTACWASSILFLILSISDAANGTVVGNIVEYDSNRAGGGCFVLSTPGSLSYTPPACATNTPNNSSQYCLGPDFQCYFFCYSQTAPSGQFLFQTIRDAYAAGSNSLSNPSNSSSLFVMGAGDCKTVPNREDVEYLGLNPFNAY